MSFEIRSQDLLGRIGHLRTKHGTIETPLLLPVVNPNAQLIPAQLLRKDFGFDAVITNSYLIWRHSREDPVSPKVHDLLRFDGVIETDSGAYQILQYGDVEVQPDEIVRFQENLDSDIAVILDVPTGQEGSKARAKRTVDETIRRADDALRVVTHDDIRWVGPVQGGIYPDLVAYSAREMGKRSFSIHALGSPTPVMEQYQFDTLVDMVMAAKLNLPPDRPLHLFGAGHPMMFAMAVAMGCDVFDSASYALFARNGRFMTVQGTAKLEDLEYFPCNCPTCHGSTPEKTRNMILVDREKFLASHNLHTLAGELQTIKQAIVDGRLWELVEARAQAHPALRRAFQRMLHYAPIFEKNTPVRKRKGPLILTPDSLRRPEISRHQKRLVERYSQPAGTNTALLLPESLLKPFRENAPVEKALRRIQRHETVHVCAYNLPYAVVPEELLDVFPLSQSVDSIQASASNINSAAKRIMKYLESARYKRTIILVEESWQMKIARFLKQKLRGKMTVKIIKGEKAAEDALSVVAKLLGQATNRNRIS